MLNSHDRDIFAATKALQVRLSKAIHPALRVLAAAMAHALKDAERDTTGSFILSSKAAQKNVGNEAKFSLIFTLTNQGRSMKWACERVAEIEGGNAERLEKNYREWLKRQSEDSLTFMREHPLHGAVPNTPTLQRLGIDVMAAGERVKAVKRLIEQLQTTEARLSDELAEAQRVSSHAWRKEFDKRWGKETKFRDAVKSLKGQH